MARSPISNISTDDKLFPSGFLPMQAGGYRLVNHGSLLQRYCQLVKDPQASSCHYGSSAMRCCCAGCCSAATALARVGPEFCVPEDLGHCGDLAGGC